LACGWRDFRVRTSKETAMADVFVASLIAALQDAA
jgi:hypothetical protein